MAMILLHLRAPAPQPPHSLELGALRARLADWPWPERVFDTRLGDAPYITVRISVPAIDAALLAELRVRCAALAPLRCALWLGGNREAPPVQVSVAELQAADAELAQRLGETNED